MAGVSRAEVESIKRRFGIVGNSSALIQAIEVAYQVASTDLSVLVLGESGAGKEFFPKIIHQYGSRKHGQYIAVNCGAIPEGTIDSELFGHVKGAFTGAVENRAGYFEEADGGTIFLDEVAELPLATQARLLRMLESGEFMRVGSSKVQKVDVRIVAATNVQLEEAIADGKFREDLYYRLSTIPIKVPALRERGDDCVLLFTQFALEFAERYRMLPVRLTEEARRVLTSYSWPGNVRQLKNITEQISIIETSRELTAERLSAYLYPNGRHPLPAIYREEREGGKSERELLYSVLYDMRHDVNDLKQLVFDLMQHHHVHPSDVYVSQHERFIRSLASQEKESVVPIAQVRETPQRGEEVHDAPIIIEKNQSETVGQSLASIEEQTIRDCLQRHDGRRRPAAEELGISERTLYRKIKLYGLEGA